MRVTSANLRKVRKSERLVLASLSLGELRQIEEGEGGFLMKSVLSEAVLGAVTHKIACMQQAPKETHAWFTYWLISLQAGGPGIGVIGGKGLPDEEGLVEISYAVAKECRGRGYAAEALAEFLDWLYEWEFVSGAVAYIKEGNTASRRVAESCGFLHEGRYEGYLVYRYMF